MRLQGKTAIITGAARGIGAAIADGYAREGARVCVADLNFAEADAVAERAHGFEVLDPGHLSVVDAPAQATALVAGFLAGLASGAR